MRHAMVIAAAILLSSSPLQAQSAITGSGMARAGAANPLAGKTLRYKIGAENPGRGKAGEIVEVGYDWHAPLPAGISIAYGNLFNEKFSEQSATERAVYGPYLSTSDTADEYGEGQIDPRGSGWRRNLVEQFERRRQQGFEYIELDNADAYSVTDVIGAVDIAEQYGLKVIAKNPGLLQGDSLPYVAHRNVYGIIVEKGAGNAHEIHALRLRAGKPNLPVWFVFFEKNDGRGESGKKAAREAMLHAQPYANMNVTYSVDGEYTSAVDDPS